MRRTKIICTIGPASRDPALFFRIAEAGMNLVRLNLSHGTLQEHAVLINLAKQYREQTGKPLGLILDIKGSGIRLGIMNENITILPGDSFVLTTETVIGDARRASISYAGRIDEVKAGENVLIDDGQIHLRIVSVSGKDIHCTVINGGLLKSEKGVNIPSLRSSPTEISSKDKKDMIFAIEHEVDYIAASFVHQSGDIIRLQEFLRVNGGESIHVIAKIETRNAVDHIDSIIDAADGIMVARGDLGIEIDIEEVPIVQKSIIKKCNTAGKPVIVATQMLDSMIRNPRPTRAEANDIANAVYESADAIMLSGETAMGRYPLEALQTMARIAEAVEHSIDYTQKTAHEQDEGASTITDAISRAACTMAINLGASAIIAPTKSGYTARMVSMHRPPCPIIALPFDSRAFNKLSLIWGVVPVLSSAVQNIDDLLDHSVQDALKGGWVMPGDTVVLTASATLNASGTTDLIKVQKIE